MSKSYRDNVKRILREKYRISWVKAMSTVGDDFLTQWEQAGNFADRTAEAISYQIKLLKGKK